MVFLENVDVKEQVDETGNCSSSVKSIVGFMLNPSGGPDSQDIRKIVISFNDGDACSPRAKAIDNTLS